MRESKRNTWDLWKKIYLKTLNNTKPNHKKIHFPIRIANSFCIWNLNMSTTISFSLWWLCLSFNFGLYLFYVHFFWFIIWKSHLCMYVCLFIFCTLQMKKKNKSLLCCSECHMRKEKKQLLTSDWTNGIGKQMIKNSITKWCIQTSFKSISPVKYAPIE